MRRVARGLLDLGQALAGLVLHAVVGVPVRSLMHREPQDDAVDQRNGADQIAQTPVGVHRGGGAVGEHVGDLLGQTRQQRVSRVADGVGDETGDNPAADHEGLAAGDEHTAVVGRHALGEHRDDRRDAAADAEAGDQAERAEELIGGRERLGQREQAVEDNGDHERLLAADAVGHDAAEGAAEHHAEQAPRGQRAHKRAGVGVVRPERVSHEQVRGVDDHEVITVEDHREREQHEHHPRVRA